MTAGISKERELEPREVVAAYEAYKRRQASGRSLATANWVTTLAHDCTAYAVFMRTVPPEQRRALDPRLGMIFSEGNDQARAVKRDLIDMGFEVSSEEGQVAWKEYAITGRRDLKIWKPGMRHRIPVEVKSCSPFTYDSINSVDDLKNHKWTFIRKWWRQLALYLVLDSEQEYWLLLKSKSSGQIKIIAVTLGDDEYRAAEEMIQKAQTANKLIQIGQMPSADMKISTPDLCSECEFFNVCLPELNFGMAAKILTDEMASELAAKTERLTELKPLAKEYEDLDEEVKAQVKSLCADGSDQVVYGDWVATIKDVEMKAQPAKTVPAKPAYTQKRVTFIKAAGPAAQETAAA